MRQKPIGNYIVDFLCYELMLAIGIDGETHNYRVEKDQVRQKRIEALGVNLIRFLDIDVKRNMDAVLLFLNNWIDQSEAAKRTPPNPPQRGNR